METQNIDISKLTPEQIKAIKAQLSVARKSLADGRPERYAIIDRMLAERDGESFKHTTADILAAMQAEPKTLVPATLSSEDHAEWLKKIQTRKQHLEKLRDEAGNLVHAPKSLGYKPSAGGFGLTPDRVIDWLMNDENVARLSKADKAAILKAMK